MSNLYELMGDYKALLGAFENEGATDAEMAALLDAVDEKKGPLKEKVDNVCRLLASIDGDVEKFKVEEARLSKRRKAMENKSNRLRFWVRSSMDILEVDRIKTSVHNVTLGKASKRVEIRDESLVPEKYVKVERKVQKALVMKAYKDDGEVIPGCEIVDGERSLTIR